MPLLGSIVQKGKLAAWALAFSTSALHLAVQQYRLLTFEKFMEKLSRKHLLVI